MNAGSKAVPAKLVVGTVCLEGITITFALCLVLLPACSTTSADAGRDSRATSASNDAVEVSAHGKYGARKLYDNQPSPGASASVSASAQAAPVSERAGLDAPVVWRLPPEAGVTRGGTARAKTVCTSEVSDQLILHEVRADSNSLYLDVSHKAARPPDKHTSAAPELAMLLGGCLAAAPRASGRLWKDWQSPSTLIVSLQTLPDGELDLFIRAFGSEAVTALRKSGRTITYLRDEERAGVVYLRGYPALGIGPALSFPDPDCGKEVSR